jgi:KaiC/GvpD/RAD55 family RecA-like ATPase
MDIPVEVPGLESIVRQVGSGEVVVLESGPDPAKSYFLRLLCRTALGKSSRVTFVTSRDEGEVHRRLAEEGGKPNDAGSGVRVIERDSVRSLEEHVAPGGLLAVDSFSFMTLDLNPVEVAALLRGLRRACRETHGTALLATDREMLDGRSEAVTAHLADGILQFYSREGPDGLARFLRIPKWGDGSFADQNVYYGFDGHRFSVDMRRRVV